MRTLFAVGMRGPVPSVEGPQIKVLPLERVREAARARIGGSALFVGPEALRRLSPDQLLESMPFPYVAVVLIDAPDSEGVLNAWLRIGVRTLRPEDSFQRVVASLHGLSPRVRIPASSWVPAGAAQDRALRHAVSLLPECRRLLIEHWAADLGVERHWLNRRFRRVCGVTATEVCHAYIYEYAEREKSRDVPRNHIAAGLGFPNPSNLRKALRVHRPATVLARHLGMNRISDLASEVPDSLLEVPDSPG